MSTTAPKRPAPRPTVASDRVRELRRYVEEARAAGVGLDAMVLHATQRDEALMRRSPEIAVRELSFANGEVRFLGVKVVRSAGPRSSLETLPILA